MVDWNEVLYCPRSFCLPQGSSPLAAHELNANGAKKLPLFNRFVVVRVLSVCHVYNNNKKNKVISKNAKPTAKKYDRQIAAMCLNIPAGNNGVLILIATMNKNKNGLFQAYCEGRDNSNGFGRGALIVLVNPSPVEEWFGQDDRRIPVLVFDWPPMYLVDPHQQNNLIPPRLILKTSDRLSGLLLTVAKIECLQVRLIELICRDYLCDGLDSHRNLKDKATCACYKHCAENSTISVLLRLKISSMCDDKENVEDHLFPLGFSSRSFTEKVLVLQGGVPFGKTLQSLQDGGAYQVVNQPYNGLFQQWQCSWRLDGNWLVSTWSQAGSGSG